MRLCIITFRGVAAVLLVAFPALVTAAPPLDCLETAKGARWCLGDPPMRSAPPVLPVVHAIHPAAVVSAPRPYVPVGQQVATVVNLLPGYFTPRLSQVGLLSESSIQTESKKK